MISVVIDPKEQYESAATPIVRLVAYRSGA